MIESIQRFLNKYGFRCINELKLEENTLHDDPSFVIDSIAGVCVCVLTSETPALQASAKYIVNHDLLTPLELVFQSEWHFDIFYIF